MLLERILLKSFGCFQRQNFDLEDGINLIFGPNFSGKSTLVNAIFFTLTGKPIAPRVGLPDLAQSGERSGTAGIGFANQGQQYQLFRSTRGEIQLRNRSENGWRVVFTGKRSVDEELKKMFHLTYHHLASTTFLREGEIFEFLGRQPADRREILYALLGIDRLMEVRQRFIEGRRIAKREEKRVQEHQQSLRVTTVLSHREEIQRIEEELLGLEGEYELLSSGADPSSDAALIAELTQNHSRLQQQIAPLRQERASVLRGFTDATHLRTAIEEIAAAIAQAEGLEAQREVLIQQIGSLTSQIQVLSTECDTLCQLIKSDQGHCPTCHQPVHQDVIEMIIADKEAQKNEYEDQLAAQNQQLEEHTANVNAMRELCQRRQLLHNKLEVLQRLDSQLIDYQREYDAVDERLRNLKPATDDQTQTDDPVQKVERRREVRFRIDNLRKRLARLNSEEAVITHKLEVLQGVNAEAEQIQQTRLSAELACEGVQKTIDTFQVQVLEPAETELQHWLKRMNIFESANIDLKTQPLLPSLQIEGKDRSLILLSGSEKMLLYLCLKVALSKALGNPGFFVFDDPTLHLDDERKVLMVDFIRQLAQDHQVIVASNDPSVREGLEGANLIETTHQI